MFRCLWSKQWNHILICTLFEEFFFSWSLLSLHGRGQQSQFILGRGWVAWWTMLGSGATQANQNRLFQANKHRKQCVNAYQNRPEKSARDTRSHFSWLWSMYINFPFSNSFYSMIFYNFVEKWQKVIRKNSRTASMSGIQIPACCTI
jgi:hypothetical protein